MSGCVMAWKSWRDVLSECKWWDVTVTAWSVHGDRYASSVTDAAERKGNWSSARIPPRWCWRLLQQTGDTTECTLPHAQVQGSRLRASQYKSLILPVLYVLLAAETTCHIVGKSPYLSLSLYLSWRACGRCVEKVISDPSNRPSSLSRICTAFN